MRRSRTIAVVVLKKIIIEAKATLVGKKTPEAAGTVPDMRAANGGITSQVPSHHSQKSLNQHLDTVMPANLKATGIKDSRQGTSPARASLRAAAVAVKKSLIAVEAKAAAEVPPEVVEKNRLIRCDNQNQKPKTTFQISTPY